MRHGSLFSGIGGFDLAAEWMGWENVFHCEWNEFGQKVLNHYWPNAESFSDITKTNFRKYEGSIDIISGGFPCQPFSLAGKRQGEEDERNLWPEMLRCIQEIKPRWIVGENVLGITNIAGGLVFDKVQTDLENECYEVQTYLLPACGINAPHQRFRIFIVAFRNSSDTGNTELQRSKFNRGIEEKRKIQREGRQFSGSIRSKWENFPTVSPICDGDDGLSDRLDSITFSKWRNESIKAGGNAVVPQLVHQIFKAIEAYEVHSCTNKESSGSI